MPETQNIDDVIFRLLEREAPDEDAETVALWAGQARLLIAHLTEENARLKRWASRATHTAPSEVTDAR